MQIHPPTTLGRRNKMPPTADSTALPSPPDRPCTVRGFRELYSLSQRRRNSRKLLARMPNHVPVFVEVRVPGAVLGTNKFACGRETSAGHLMLQVRGQLRLCPDATQALSLLLQEPSPRPALPHLPGLAPIPTTSSGDPAVVADERDPPLDPLRVVFPAMAATLGTLVQDYEQPDGFVYAYVVAENTFG